MFHYPDLGSDSDWSRREGNLLQPIRSTTQICNQYGISAIVCKTSFRGKPDGEMTEMTAVCSDYGGACYLLVELKNILLTVLCQTKK